MSSLFSCHPSGRSFFFKLAQKPFDIQVFSTFSLPHDFFHTFHFQKWTQGARSSSWSSWSCCFPPAASHPFPAEHYQLTTLDHQWSLWRQLRLHPHPPPPPPPPRPTFWPKTGGSCWWPFELTTMRSPIERCARQRIPTTRRGCAFVVGAENDEQKNGADNTEDAPAQNSLFLSCGRKKWRNAPPHNHYHHHHNPLPFHYDWLVRAIIITIARSSSRATLISINWHSLHSSLFIPRLFLFFLSITFQSGEKIKLWTALSHWEQETSKGDHCSQFVQSHTCIVPFPLPRAFLQSLRLFTTSIFLFHFST